MPLYVGSEMTLYPDPLGEQLVEHKPAGSERALPNPEEVA